jgi:hypothetical protein
MCRLHGHDQKTYLRQRRFHDLSSWPKLANFVQDFRQSSQGFQQHGNQTCALSTTGCPYCYAEAFLGLAGGSKDTCLESE